MSTNTPNRAARKPGYWGRRRPKRADEDRRNYPLSIRLSASERLIIEGLADAAGMTVSDFFRAAARNQSIQYLAQMSSPTAVKPAESVPADPVTVDIYRAVRAVGGMVREVYLRLDKRGYDPASLPSMHELSGMNDRLAEIQAALEQHLSLPPGPPVEIIAPQKGKQRREIREFEDAGDDLA